MHQLTERQPASSRRSRSLVRSIATITLIMASLAILLALGTWQAVLFVELDGPRDRRVIVTVK